MGVSVAEYLGQRTDVDTPIEPVVLGNEYKCPFMANHTCRKAKKGDEPVCSVRGANGEFWIVCEDRLCATKKDILLCDHQVEILHDIAKHVFYPSISKDEVCVKREVNLSTYGKARSKSLKADYILSTKGAQATTGPDRLVLEMQGGGETSSTGEMTKCVKEWRRVYPHRNELLCRDSGPKARPLPNNAWKRQQDQFLVKGDVAMKTRKGLGMVFCVGTILYDYIIEKIRPEGIPDLKDYNWTLCLMGIKEDTSKEKVPGPVPVCVDQSRLLYTNYQTFVQALINRGEPTPDAFKGEFLDLNNEYYFISF